MEPTREAPISPPRAAPASDLDLARVRTACKRGRDYLLSIQAVDGSWCGELEGDTILESEYILTMVFIGRQADPKLLKAAEYIRRKQLPDGAWSLYPQGPSEISVSSKAYFVLKLLGDAPDAPHMVRARETILRLGGLDACNSYTKIYLAIFGQYPWARCPAIPPSLILFPTWFPFNIYALSSWARGILVPLSILWAHKPHCAIPASAHIDELRTDVQTGPSDVTKYTGARTGWTRFFALADKWVKLCDKLHLRPLRRWGIRRSKQWMLAHLEQSDGIGAIFPPIINTIYALRCLGYERDDPVLEGQIHELERLEIEEEETLRVQPCFSAAWDTAPVANALHEAGLGPEEPALRRASSWLLDHEVRSYGDWAKTVKGVEPGGWYFEYANEHYPDCDDTAEVLMFLGRVRHGRADEDTRRQAAMQRGLDWLLAMQNDDGGWAAFDKGCDRAFLTHIPFADHNAMLDPSCADITGRTLRALASLGFVRDDPIVRRAIEYTYATQEPDGTWYGRWGCNYVYGTWLALVGLTAAGEDPSDPRVQRSADWLRAVQNEDGGWGELQASYDDPTLKGTGPSTAAQTAWALLGLLATGDTDSQSVRRGVTFLLEHQRPDGSWCDETWTATGFPRVFYLRYHLYASQFPVIALATLRDRVQPRGNEAR